MKLFVSGIDTDAGKTYCTAWLARRFMNQGLSAITQKFIQTGCISSSEDIEAHRRLCGMEMQSVDLDGTTCPIIFSYPASAQLAAQIDGRVIDLGLVDKASERLESQYDVVLIEGAGGLMVPIADDYFTIDYVKSRKIPMALVTNGILGSINHTILSLEAIKSRGIKLEYVLYNSHFDRDTVIATDTLGFIRRYLSQHFPSTELLEVPSFE